MKSSDEKLSNSDRYQEGPIVELQKVNGIQKNISTFAQVIEEL